MEIPVIEKNKSNPYNPLKTETTIASSIGNKLLKAISGNIFSNFFTQTQSLNAGETIILNRRRATDSLDLPHNSTQRQVDSVIIIRAGERWLKKNSLDDY